MKRFSIAALLFFLTVQIVHSQEADFLNLDDIGFVDQTYLCNRPANVRFTADEDFLYIGFSLGDSCKISKYDCENRKIVFEKAFKFYGLQDFAVSPDEKNLVVAGNGGIYYIPDFATASKSYMMSAQSIGDLSQYMDRNYLKGWVSSHQICVNGNLFDFTSWTFSTGNYGGCGADAANYLSRFNTRKNELYYLALREGNADDPVHYKQLGLFLQAVKDPEYYKSVFFDNTYSLAPIKISMHSKRFAFYKNNRLHVQTPVLAKKEYEYFCFQVKNPFGPSNKDFWEGQKEWLLKKMDNKEYITARVCAARIHPITNQPLGAGEPIAELQLVKYEGDWITGRLLRTFKSGVAVTEGNYVDLVKSLWKGGNALELKQDVPLVKCPERTEADQEHTIHAQERTLSGNTVQDEYTGHYSSLITGGDYKHFGSYIFYKTAGCTVSNAYLADVNNQHVSTNVIKQGQPLYLTIALLNFSSRNGKFKYRQSTYMEDGEGNLYAKSENTLAESPANSFLWVAVGGGLRSLPGSDAQKALYISFKIEDEYSAAKVEGYFKIEVVR